ncbi:L-asparaginase [Venturia canescens]|uniref:L-asparaginase n=1 Tax=Venturia canescens TaxID=32260 RepID=UPI001C9C797E|nr:L-asparaginase [Venturia canescens]XP_043272759.1 L-asparaginase [Venturia canescens]XP_043272760.1 L-asparaginase [Venturia canescens]XP_043272761.1 L-asparaginase [Venturia canescens]
MPSETRSMNRKSSTDLLRNVEGENIKNENGDETAANEESSTIARCNDHAGTERNNFGLSQSDLLPDMNSPISLKKINTSTGSMTAEIKPEGRVLVLYTGGTIGMVRNEKGALAPVANTFVKTVKKYPHMHDSNYAEERFGILGPLVLPLSANDSRRIIYNVIEYSPLCDSSNMTMDDWIRIAIDIKKAYESYDGFVVLHGTDTLSYTASALSFMLESLGKTVVITGSQLPIFEARSDGLINFLSSLVIAGNYNIPEVCVFFGNQLMRGNRTSKIASAAFEAFGSPNCPPLAVAGVKINVDYRSIFRPCALEKFHVHKNLSRNVGLLRIFPSITSELVRAFLQAPIEGVVLQTYGAGNVPNNRNDIFKEIREATDRGVIIVNITQCSRDGVIDWYESGKLLVEAGVTLGYDMTPEAALTKLAYVLSKTSWDCKMKRKMMETSLRGEMSICKRVNVGDNENVMRSLGLHSESQLLELAPIIFPALMSEAVVTGDFIKVKSLQNYGADISQPNADRRTVLHVACCDAQPDVVRQLLEMGANVHMKDRFDRTPLTEAIENDRHEIIELLLQCGGHLHENSLILGGKLCAAAAAGNTTRLRSYLIAGGDLGQADVSGRTAMHSAALHNKHSVIRLLLDEGVDHNCRDIIGQTPRDLAKLAGSVESFKLLGSLTRTNGHPIVLA